MQDSISHNIQKAAQELLKTVHMPIASTVACLNSTLNQFFTGPFRADSIRIIDSEGKSANYDTVIYTGSTPQSENQPIEVKADAVSCCMHVVGTIGLEELQAGYEHIAVIKRLKRTQPLETNNAINNTPLGIIFAINSDIPIDKIAELMIPLNKKYPSSEWPDMVVILTRGTINYGMQIYGEQIKGDLLLPNKADFPVMPMYVHLLARGLGLFSINKMYDLIFRHLQTFSPGIKLPNTNEVLENIARSAITISAYQFDLKRQLVPVPNEMYLKQGVFTPLTLRIEDKKGNLLSHLQFVPWDNGGVVRLIGKLPLDNILASFGSIATNGQIIRQPNGAISSVLPINKNQFIEMIDRFQKQSNTNIITEKTKWIMQKVADEGTTSPFRARLHLGVLNIRDVVFASNKERNEFDDFYQVVLNTLINARTTSKEIAQLLTEHHNKVSQGKIVRLDRQTIHISESIDDELRKQVEGFLYGSVRVVKDGMQDLLKFLQLNIGFLYKDQGAFNNGITAFTKLHPELAVYLQETRKWSEPLILVRNSLHESWMLPNMVYNEIPNSIQAVEPKILGQPVSEFIEYILDRLCCFVEEVTVYSLQTKMPSELSITEIPISDRQINCRKRFKVAFVPEGSPIWKIAYHASKFDET